MGFLLILEMQDVQTREDLHLIMRNFYVKLLNEPEINFIFTDVAKIDLEPHLVDLVNFWEQILFNKGSYQKNVLQIHLDINSKLNFTQTHFSIWLKYFNSSIDENFKGQNAENMKTRALSIATVMQIKMANKQ